LYGSQVPVVQVLLYRSGIQTRLLATVARQGILPMQRLEQKRSDLALDCRELRAADTQRG
jgi:hypothetical protein